MAAPAAALAIDWNEALRRLIKYAVVALVTAFAAFALADASGETALVVGLVAAATFSVLDTLSPATCVTG